MQRFTYTLGLTGLVLLLLPLMPGLGTEKFGARIWIAVGPYSFQPAEAAKVLLAIAFASLSGGETGRAGPGRLSDYRGSICLGRETSGPFW